jgi:radical SAM superfamily enzyme YgiQ (UPF0313 family)
MDSRFGGNEMKWSQIERARSVLARERGTIVKDWGGKLSVALVYPNTYHVGMSSLGLHALYRLFNAHRDIVCERAFWRPHRGEPACTIESQRSLDEFSVVAFTLSFEMDYPNLVHMLTEASIPLRANERDESWPLVIAGGPAVSANPLPVADFLDAVVIGEAEEIVPMLTEVLGDVLPGPRDVVWRALARIPSVYVPALSTEPSPIQRQWVCDLDAYPTATVVHTPDTEFGDIHLIEISRGCGRGCRFCMTGFTYRPKRERSVAVLLEEARRGLAWGERIGLVGAAVSDYSQIDELAMRLRELGARISVSSLRVDPLSDSLLRALAESGTRTLTMAPEAGSERLRQVINKGVAEADVLDAAKRANTHRFRQLKLYFMIGLPTEEQEDIEAIAQLSQAAAARFSGQVTVNVTPFVPKAHTPFQWAEVTPYRTVKDRLQVLQRRLRRQGISVKSESPRWSAIQAMLARGDRRLGSVLASLNGASFGAWQRALAAHGLGLDDALAARSLEVPLPWEFIDTGVNQAYLRREWERAQTGNYTAACPPSGCSRCGACSDDC